MRNLKKLLAVIVAVCVLATFTVPAFAETKTDAQVCTDLGVLKGAGAGVTADYLTTQPDRLQGAIMFLRLKGLEDTAKAFIGTDNFSDVEGLNDTNQAILAYLKANPDLGFGGIGDNKFSPLTKMSAKEYYKVMLVALGYTYETDFTWANVFGFAASKGLTKLIDNEKFTVNDLAIATVEALKTTVKGGTDTLIAKLVDGGSIASATAVASGLYTATPKAVEVVSATTDNLKTAKIVFNQELDSATIKAANFYNSDVTLDPKLLDDKKTVIVVFNTKKDQSKTADIVIENVKSTAGVKIAKVTKTITFVDTTIPTISGAVAKNAKTIIISASEPINDVESDYVKNFGDIKIDGTAVLATPAFDYAKNTITLKLASLIATGSHKIEIAKLADFAGYVAVTQTYNFDVAADTTAPAVTAAKLNNPTELELTFSEDVETNGSFRVNGTDATFKSKSATDNSKITITLGKALDIGATVEVKVEYKGQKDVNDNEVKDWTSFITKFADDTTKPTVSVTIESGNKIVLTFSKGMAKVGTMKLYNTSDNKQIGVSIDLSTSKATWESSDTVCKIAAADASLDNTNAKEIKINLTGMKDATVRANELGETNLTTKALDTKKPTVSANYTVKAGTKADKSDDTITFYFSEAMDADTAKNLSNYVLTSTGAALGTNQALALYGSDASFQELASDGKNVVLKVKGISAATTEQFTVYALKDIAGNMLASTSGIAKTAAVGANLVSYTATEEKKVELVFDQAIGTFQPNAVVIRESNTANATVSAVVIKADIDSTNATKVALTLDRSIGTVTDKAWLSQLDNKLVKDVYGTESATFAALKLTDKIKPTVTFEATSAGILIKFSEVVNTTAATLIAEMQLTKDGADKVPTVGAISVVEAGKVFKVGGLDVNTEYKISLYPKATVDVANSNPFVPTEIKAVTTKE